MEVLELLRRKGHLSAETIASDLGVAHHRIIPEFLKARTPDDTIDRGLGIFRLRGFAYRATLTDVDRVVHEEDGATVVEYHTPVGSVSCKMTLTDEMLDSGASITWLNEHVIKRPEDYHVVGHIFRHMRLAPDYDNYREFQREVGDRGLAVVHGLGSASPVQHLMRDFIVTGGDTGVRVLSLDDTVAAAAQLAIPELADWCIIDLLDADASFRRVAAIAADPERQKILDPIRALPTERGSRRVGVRVSGVGGTSTGRSSSTA